MTDWHLWEYYAIPHVSADESAHFAFGERQFRRAGRRFARAVEVGCGSTLHHAALLAPHVERLTLADYLPANLAEVRKWLDGEPDAHDWEVYFGGLAGGADVAALLRRRVIDLLPVDVRHPRPPGDVPAFDLVASSSCIECSTGDRVEWRERLANATRLVARGGVLLLGALRRCREYHVLGRTFPTAPVDEADFAAVLPTLGFDPSRMVIEAVPVAEWAGQGFDSVCCAWAEKG